MKSILESAVELYRNALRNKEQRNQNKNQFVIQEDELSEVKWFLIDNVIKMIKTHDPSIVFKENRLDLFKKLKDVK